MKNLIIYYIVILLPLCVLFWILFSLDNSKLFIILLLIYGIVFRPLIDAYRLIKKGVIQKKSWWKMFSPIAHVKWFRELYLK